MRAQLDDCRRRGEPVAYLWATEDTIYGRFGYGIASVSGEIEIARERTAYHASPEMPGDARLVGLEEAEALVAPVYERVAAATPGMFARTPAWWQARVLDDPDWRRAGAGQLQCVIVDLHLTSADPLQMIRDVRAAHPALPIVAYYSHIKTDLSLQATQAGCTLVLPRSAFVQRLPELLAHTRNVPPHSLV